MLDETQATDFKSVSFSETVITELMIPSYANFGGKIHGGIILSLMDKVAYVCAAKHAGNYSVTASIDTVDFLHPVEVGDLVSLMAAVNYVGKSSMVVGIRVISQNIKTGEVRHTNTSYFTMIAKDEQNKPVQVPGLLLENEEQVRRFVEAKRRKEIKQAYRQESRKIKAPVNDEHAQEMLQGERCQLQANYNA
ncbi:acyl-CoA thioesterase [Mucilaginibacter robiniae]|uniref:Acyl-CoA thioesterase n=1 Tax=Mucilaginibacter robiniae TaxID=2728022 RepID=A0A7L5E837_9SPHI|nr:acyl-CoA thioesterase [Mucilaginibacter robiniae]QJD97033.1 acyl-CoA thioesterase [Mucilaginibacter robiniae]